MRVFIAAVGSIALAAASCSQPAPAPPFQISIRVDGDPGRALANAQISRAGKPIGLTNAEGRTTLTLEGAEGEVTDIVVTCPEGHQSPPKPVSIKLARLADRRIPEYSIACPPAVRRVVVAVRAENGANLPVVYLSRPVTRTDASGAASFALEVAPGSQFSVGLDTSERKDMKPISPQRVFVVSQQDEVFLFDQKFEIEKKRTFAAPAAAVPRALN